MVQFYNVVTFSLIGIISALFIIKDQKEKPYSLNLMHWFFFFVFFFLLPLLQYLKDCFPIWLSSEDGYYILLTNLLLISWMVFYALGYRFSKPTGSILFKKLRVRKRGVLVSVYLSFFVFIIFISVFGIENLLIRGSYRDVLSAIHPHSIMLFIDKSLRVLPVISLMGLLALKFRWKNKRQWWFLTSALILINLFVNNPIASPRYWAGTVVLAFIVFFFLRSKRRKGWLLPVLFIGVLFVFPIINVFRTETIKTISIKELKQATNLNIATAQEFDAYEMTVHTVQYIEKSDNVSYGRQLLGAFLFWIPRDLWKNKPTGSGGVVARFFSYPFLNLCCPLPAEGYINFGIFGLILFAFCFGWLLRMFDEHYWIKSNLKSPDILRVLYPFLLGFTFYLMRGDFMSGFSYTIMFVIWGLIFLIR
ncbi:oligosaccharide repeat unit polymerase [candidate division WOR-3 bacterium]|nr:oligosaccharide repeat unit polymerase [candidate division WOR-3 bacterium]